MYEVTASELAIGDRFVAEAVVPRVGAVGTVEAEVTFVATRPGGDVYVRYTVVRPLSGSVPVGHTFGHLRFGPGVIVDVTGIRV